MSIDALLTIEAPIGYWVYGPQTVPANNSVTVPILRDNCASVLLKVGGAHRIEYTQAFVLPPPEPGFGRPIYLAFVAVEYDDGKFAASVTANTEK
jgi:hypothetical protein